MEPAGVERIDDASDPRISDYLHLNDAAARAAAGRDGEAGCAIVEGVVAVTTVVQAGGPLRSLLLAPERVAPLTAILASVPVGVAVYVAERPILAQIVGFDLHRGVLASAERPTPPDPDELLGGSGRVVLTEGLNDHENLGSLFRNAAALGFDGVLLDGRTADPLYRRSIRVSSGWSIVLPHLRFATLPDGYGLLRGHGFRIVALTPSRDAVAVDVAASSGLLDDRIALVVGAEGPGLSEAALAASDVTVRVPMARAVDSVNVATSLAIVGAFAAARSAWNSVPPGTEDV